MVSTVIAKTSSVSGNCVPERSGAELGVISSTWLVGFLLLVFQAVDEAGATHVIDLASLWSSRVEAEQSGLTVKL